MEQIQHYYKIGLQRLENFYRRSNALCLTGVALMVTGAALMVTGLFLRYTSTNTNTNHTTTKNKKSRKNQENMSTKAVPLSKESHIDNVSMRFHQEYKPGLLQLVEKYNSQDEKNRYNKRYYNEMLLKLVIELDGIDITDLPTNEKTELKNRRKTVIREIQKHLQLLDTLPRN